MHTREGVNDQRSSPLSPALTGRTSSYACADEDWEELESTAGIHYCFRVKDDVRIELN